MNEKELELLFEGGGVSESNTGFPAEQLAKCPSCHRNNGPSRMKCIYCGALLEFEAVADGIRLKQGQLEAWQKGWNVVLLPNQPIDKSIVSKISDEMSHWIVSF